MKKEILHEHQIGRKIYLKKIGFLPEFYGVSLEGKNNDWKIENNFLPSPDLSNRRPFKFLNWKILISSQNLDFLQKFLYNLGSNKAIE